MEASINSLVIAFAFSLLLCSAALRAGAGADPLQTYIVQLHPDGPTRLAFASELEWHLSFVHRTLSRSPEEVEVDPSSRLLYSYRSAMDGFAARLSDSERKSLERMSDVVAVRPDRVLQVQTTYSYKFLGLDPPGGAWTESRFGQGTIIGVLDTGVWPESPSFGDRGMPPVPKKWKGTCQEGQGFNSSNCNRKLIGARFFTRGHRAAASSPSPPAEDVVEYVSPRDSHGHGTHTSSTAGGASVATASVLGNGAGTARGMAPGAHIAVYKVCWFSGCYSSDILAAMDAAIRDGVDVLSLSLGGFPTPLYADTIAIGSFRAVERGVSVVCSAGNNGPTPSSVANEAPWILTVGAGTLDRRFPATVRLGDGKFLYGESVYSARDRSTTSGEELELIYVAGGNTGSEFCSPGSLPGEKVRGKMVVCDRGVNRRSEQGQAVKEAGGVAMILANTETNLEENSVVVHVLPATAIGYSESILLKAYINSTARPRARIEFGGTVVGKSRAPAVAQFSARGPSLTNPTILKPDVIAPGVNIIAAWPQNLGPSGLPEDSRRVNFSVMSGTSMACPHVGGIAALLRSVHPGWTPAAVKSAIMTTSETADHSGKPIMDGNKPAGIFAVGSGHVNPARAIDPGLIYDIDPDDYIAHLCTLGYTGPDIFAITHRNVTCRELSRKNRGFTLNYPSISVIFRVGTRRKMVRRRVTNVGEANSVYSAEVAAPEGLSLRVRPRRLVFRRRNQTLSYRVWFIARKRARTPKLSHSQGHLTWVHSGQSVRRVRSPISVTWRH